MTGDVETLDGAGLDPNIRAEEGDSNVTEDNTNEEYVSDNEDTTEVLMQVDLDTQWGDPATVRARKKKASKRFTQHVDYARLVEDRLLDLESRLEKIENKKIKLEGAKSPSDWIDRRVDLILSRRRMTVAQYLPIKSAVGNPIRGSTTINHKARFEFPGQRPYHLIDVIFGNEQQGEQFLKDQTSKSLIDSPKTDVTHDTAQTQQTVMCDEQHVQPERIRLNSNLLLEALEKITGASFTKSTIDDERVLLSQVVLRPFKFFITHEQKIRDEVARLERLHELLKDRTAMETEPSAMNQLARNGSTEACSDSGAASSIERDEDSRFDSTRCLEELRVLRDLLDEELKPTFLLRKQVQDGLTPKIAFQDLWHLFPQGTMVVFDESNGNNQVCRILDVTGGRPFLCERRDVGMECRDTASSNAQDVPRFDLLTCYYYSNGKDFGLVQQAISIRQYDGLKTITSLPCYPLQYAKTLRTPRTGDFFVERGKRFMELTWNHKMVHKRYQGLSLAMDDLREEVSQYAFLFRPPADAPPPDRFRDYHRHRNGFDEKPVRHGLRCHL